MLESGRGFASDNNSGAHPEILRAIERANVGHAVGYGSDTWTARAQAAFCREFGDGVETFFVFNGTAANVLSIQAATRPFHAVVCARTSHIQNDECGAPERFTGCKLLLVDTPDGKLTPELIRTKLHGIGDVHHVQPRVISITQVSELGTVYTVAEIRALAELARSNGMILHMDGARISNAAASLGVSLRAITRDAGVDVLSFGGTKNGLLLGEAVVFFDPALARDFGYSRKQAMQLASKMRFIAAQFEALLDGQLWLKNASHANAMAKKLEAGLRTLPGLEISRKVEANLVFGMIPEAALPRLVETAFFYVWDPIPDSRGRIEVRWVCSFDTSESDVEAFVAAVGAVLERPFSTSNVSRPRT